MHQSGSGMTMCLKASMNFWSSDAPGTRTIRLISHLTKLAAPCSRPTTKGRAHAIARLDMEVVNSPRMDEFWQAFSGKSLGPRRSTFSGRSKRRRCLWHGQQRLATSFPRWFKAYFPVSCRSLNTTCSRMTSCSNTMEKGLNCRDDSQRLLWLSSISWYRTILKKFPTVWIPRLR